MAQFPAMPFWTDAYIGDTTHLTTIEHGAYLLLLIAMWRTGEARLPADDKLLARYARLGPQQWQRIKSTMMRFFDSADGFITQGRLVDEWNALKDKSDKAKDAAETRWGKHRRGRHRGKTAPPVAVKCQPESPFNGADDNPLKTLELGDADGNARSMPTTTTTSSKNPKRDSYYAWPADAFEQFWEKYPEKVGKKAAHKAFVIASKSDVAWALILPALDRYIASKPEDRAWCHPATWLNQGRWEDQPAQNGGVVNGHGRSRSLQDDSKSVSKAADRLIDATRRGEFSIGPRPSLLPDKGQGHLRLLPKG